MRAATLFVAPDISPATSYACPPMLVSSNYQLPRLAIMFSAIALPVRPDMHSLKPRNLSGGVVTTVNIVDANGKLLVIGRVTCFISN